MDEGPDAASLDVSHRERRRDAILLVVVIALATLVVLLERLEPK